MIYDICVWLLYRYIAKWIANITGTSLHSIGIGLLMCNSGPQVTCQLVAAKFTKRCKQWWRLRPQWFQQGEASTKWCRTIQSHYNIPLSHIWTRFIRPVSGSTTGPPLFPALQGSIFRMEICAQHCPAAFLRQLHWWLHPLSRPGLKCFHRSEIGWKCLTWISIAVGWISMIFESVG